MQSSWFKEILFEFTNIFSLFNLSCGQNFYFDIAFVFHFSSFLCQPDLFPSLLLSAIYCYTTLNLSWPPTTKASQMSGSLRHAVLQISSKLTKKMIAQNAPTQKHANFPKQIHAKHFISHIYLYISYILIFCNIFWEVSLKACRSNIWLFHSLRTLIKVKFKTNNIISIILRVIIKIIIV